MSVLGQVLAFVSEWQADILIVLISFGIHAAVFGKHFLFGRPGGRTKPTQPYVPAEKPAAKKIREASSATEALCFLNEAISDGTACGEVLLASASAAKDYRDEALAVATLKALPDKPQQELVTAALSLYKLIARLHILKRDTHGTLACFRRMQAHGLVPSRGCFCELIEVAVRERCDVVWDLLKEMKHCGVTPNEAICMQALKYAQRSSKPDSMEQALKVVEELGDTICETVFSAVCEAGIQTGSYHLLIGQLKKHWNSGKVHATSPYTYASVIRAYGYTRDLREVWAAWNQMKTCHIAPASVTLGCMVEALAANGDVESGYQVIREHISDPEMKPLVNAVIYCSVLKGFSHQKRFDRVWSIYEEMRCEQMEFSIVTYNTLIDACSRSRDISRIPEMIEEMAAANIKPNTITYSAIIKGYCSCPENRMNQAFVLLEQMNCDSQVKPDEVTYNTLLDGCARFGMWERGMKLLEEMQEAGVKPSNFTLSVVVKLANRSKHHCEGFQLASDLAKKYSIRLNIHVFDNLIQGYLLGDDFARCLQVFEQLLHEQVRPDERTYKLLLQAAVAAKSASDAAGLMRAAGGLRGAHPIVAGYSDLARPKGGLSADLVCETIEGIAGICGSEALVREMLLDLEGVSTLPLDRRRLMRLTVKALWAQNGS